MTKKNYAAIAEAMKEAREECGEDDTIREYQSRLLVKLYSVFGADNPRFDNYRFMCAVRGE